MSTSTPQDGFNQEETVDFRSYLRPIWRRKWIIATIVVLVTAGTYLYARHEKKSYTASTLVYFSVADPTTPVSIIDTPGTTVQPPDGQQMTDITSLMTAQSVTQAVENKLKVSAGAAENVDASLLDTTATSNNGTSFIVVSATSGSPRLAARLANTYVSVYLASRSAAEVSAANAAVAADRAELATVGTSAANASQRQTLLTQITALREITLNPNPGAHETSPALVPTVPSSASPVRDAVFAAIIALLFSVAIVFGFDIFDRRLVRVATIESLYRRPVLAVLPHVRNAAPVVDGRPVLPETMIETMRTLRINLRVAGGEHGPRVIVVTSAVPGEGKSTVARDLALIYADAGERTLLIDADMRRPSIPKLFGIDDTTVGLAQVLRGEAYASDSVRRVLGAHDAGASTNGNGSAPTRGAAPAGSLDVLAHGDYADNPVALLSSIAMEQLLQQARDIYDVVVIDTAPVLAVSDAVMLLGMADAGLVVARLGVTTRDIGKRMTEVLARLPKARIAGVVVNDLRDTGFLDEGYGTSYSGYGGPRSQIDVGDHRHDAAVTSR